MTFPKLKFFTEIQKAQRILLAGAGGGFDIYCGLPLYFDLLEMGKEVYLANLSFADLHSSDAKSISDFAVEVKATTRGKESYFPELHLVRWLAGQGYKTSLYAFDTTGVKPLQDNYQTLIKLLNLDTIILIDGGTDSLMRGDEADLGTPQEDAASIAAVHFLEAPVSKILVCLGFGVDTHHGVSHFEVLQTVADLTRSSDYLGAWSLTPDMQSVERYREAFQYATQKMPTHPSIVSASVLDGIYGEFGDFHRTERTRGSELFINPLMGLYWTFNLTGIAKRNLYLEQIRNTQTYWELRSSIEVFRANHQGIKSWKGIPL